MNKTVLMAATAVLALTAGSALAGSHPTLGVKSAHLVPIHAPGKALYNQNSNFGYGIVSQNFSATFSATYDAAGADDFLVPAGAIWNVTGMDVTGVYFNGSGPATSEVITFYKDSKGKPGKMLGKPHTVTCTDSAGSFACSVKQKIDNSAGTKKARYWVSIVANLNFSAGGEWGWVENTVTHNDPGKWQNPGGGFGTVCTTWTDTSTCIPTAGADDFAFELTGKKS